MVENWLNLFFNKENDTIFEKMVKYLSKIIIIGTIRTTLLRLDDLIGQLIAVIMYKDDFIRCT